MKYICTFIVFLVAASMSAFTQVPLSLSQCYHLARENYPLIHQYELIKLSEQFKLSNISKRWLPQLSLNVQASYQNEVTKLPFDEKLFSSLMPGSSIPVLNKDQYRVVAQIDQVLWDGGNMQASKALTRAETKAQKEQLESELYVIQERINELYFGCLLQEELLKQNKLLQNDLQNNMKQITSMIHNGVANQSDLETMQVELLNAQQKEIELQAEREAFRFMLGTFIHRQLTDDVILTLPKLPERFVTTAYNRPELRTLDAQSKLLQNRTRLLKAGVMPRFSAFFQGGYGRPALNMLSNEFEGFYVAGVRLSWNIGNFYTLKNERKDIELKRKLIDRQKETFLFNTQLLLLKEDTEIKKIKELMKSDEEIIRLRKNIKKAAEVKLRNGVITVNDLIREINAEDLARKRAAIHHIIHVMHNYKRLFITD